MGRERRSSRIYLTDFSLTNSLIEPPEGEVRGVETVDVDTLDNFLRRLDIERVGILKIDAEGFDMEVLDGGRDALSNGIAQFVIVEVGFQSGTRATLPSATSPDGCRKSGTIPLACTTRI